MNFPINRYSISIRYIKKIGVKQNEDVQSYNIRHSRHPDNELPVGLCNQTANRPKPESLLENQLRTDIPDIEAYGG
ncbi:hypothetical protein BACI349Y_880013 [Bacillus sp. 349Y]|nr:hypothetical protein BACI349Y_880013 [Bacillus sp. 349Y]